MLCGLEFCGLLWCWRGVLWADADVSTEQNASVLCYLEIWWKSLINIYFTWSKFITAFTLFTNKVRCRNSALQCYTRVINCSSGVFLCSLALWHKGMYTSPCYIQRVGNQSSADISEQMDRLLHSLWRNKHPTRTWDFVVSLLMNRASMPQPLVLQHAPPHITVLRVLFPLKQDMPPK
jgi:hypothetical protein